MTDSLIPLDQARRRDGDEGVSNLLLDRFLVGETLTDDELAAVEQALANDPAARAYVDGMQADVEAHAADELGVARALKAIREDAAAEVADVSGVPVAEAPSTADISGVPVAEAPSTADVSGVPVATAPTPIRRRWVGPAIGGAIALAAAILLMTQLGGGEPGPVVDPGTRIKGGENFELVVKRQAGADVSLVLDGENLYPNDAVRFRVSHQGPAYVGVVGLDSAGVISVYEPESGTLARLEDSKDYVFPGSIVLDDTLGPERFVTVFCKQPLTHEDLASAAKAAMGPKGDVGSLGELSLPCVQKAVTINKVKR